MQKVWKGEMIMTRETFDTAKDILADIDSLKRIKAEYNDRCDIAFSGRFINNEILRDDLRTFVDVEIAKLEEEFEKL